MKNLLLIIDPQVDFITGSLEVSGAKESMTKLANLIKYSSIVEFDNIIVTLDSHQPGHISFRSSWLVRSWEDEGPITQITPEMIGDSAKLKDLNFNLDDIRDYIKRLPGCCLNLWPDHCIVGTKGHSIYPDLYNALTDWTKKNQKSWGMILKGNRPDREMYSAISCDGEINEGLGHTPIISKELLKEYDKIYIAGIAKDYCVAETITDLLCYFGEEVKNKLIFLERMLPCISEDNSSLKIYEDAVKNHGAEINRGLGLGC